MASDSKIDVRPMLIKKLIQLCSATINYYYQALSVFHHPHKKVLQPSYLVSFTPEEQEFLEKCAYSFNFDVDYSRGFRQKELFTVRIPKVSFLGNSGAVVWDRKVITESVFDQMRLVKSPAFRSPALLLPKSKRGLYSSLLHLPWAEKSNYHWFLDSLPRLLLLLKIVKEPLTLIVSQNMPAFQRETLLFVLDTNPYIRLAYIPKHEKWNIDEFILPSFVANHYSGYLPPDILRALREKIWAGYQVAPGKIGLRLYISRQKAPKRKILNDADVIAALQPYHVKILFAEELTYQQQVQLFYNAEVVIAPHGAGLTNILFSKQIKLLELHPGDIIKSHYFMLSKSLGFPYYYSIGSKSDADQNFVVDIPDFKKQLARLFVS